MQFVKYYDEIAALYNRTVLKDGCKAWDTWQTADGRRPCKGWDWCLKDEKPSSKVQSDIVFG